MSNKTKVKGEMFAYGGLWWETIRDGADFNAFKRIVDTYDYDNKEFRDMTDEAKVVGFNWIGIAAY